MVADLHGRAPAAWGLDIAGIETHVRTTPGVRTLALTFDACGGPHGSGVDHTLLDALRSTQTPATLFINQRWVKANPELTRELVADPLFSIQNHGTSHKPLSVTGQAAYGIAGTESLDAALEEVVGNRDLLQSEYGNHCTWFRSGTAHYDDVAIEMCRRIGVRIAGFATNMDGGATFTQQQVTSNLMSAPDGAILIAHMNQPSAGTGAGVAAALGPLHAQGVRFVHLG
ncbi:polysaccharide deacetylase [Corynebacterium tapiri]|uniref:Polysaccharide deacetylase n=2 Tax=Corynebacterium tapiri TaxID=1448266 RepID=A0A5C4U767_9CORY|nr:polysaccharide deacetylase [Corynebacterium tapiri]